MDRLICNDQHRDLRCKRDAGHFPNSLHRDGLVTWGFRSDAKPEWLRRAEAMREAVGYRAVKELAA